MHTSLGPNLVIGLGPGLQKLVRETKVLILVFNFGSLTHIFYTHTAVVSELRIGKTAHFIDQIRIIHLPK